jgi:hypothetical protein
MFSTGTMQMRECRTAWWQLRPRARRPYVEANYGTAKADALSQPNDPTEFFVAKLVRELLESLVSYGIFSPILKIKVPPFGVVHGEPLRFHLVTKQITVPVLQ